MTKARLVLVFLIIIIGVGGLYFYWNKPVGEMAQQRTGEPQAGANTAQLANPASVNCTKQGGTLEIRDETNGQAGYCHLPSGEVCEEWALMRGECGAVKAATLDPVLSPLYSGATWGPVVASTNGDLKGSEATSSAAKDTNNIAAVTKPFTTYYEQKLKADGWTVDNARAAGGPGSEIMAYTKGDAYIVIGFTSVFKKKSVDAPAQCPCDVTFSVFSGTKAQ